MCKPGFEAGTRELTRARMLDGIGITSHSVRGEPTFGHLTLLPVACQQELERELKFQSGMKSNTLLASHINNDPL